MAVEPPKTRRSPRGKPLRAVVAPVLAAKTPSQRVRRKYLTCTSCGCDLPPEAAEGSYQLFWNDGSGMCDPCVRYFLKDAPELHAK